MTAPEKHNARGQAGEVGNAEHIDTDIIDRMADEIKARIMIAGRVAPSDFEPRARLSFWAALQRVRDELPHLRPDWRTLDERHVDGIRVRERIFRLKGGAQ